MTEDMSGVHCPEYGVVLPDEIAGLIALLESGRIFCTDHTTPVKQGRRRRPPRAGAGEREAERACRGNARRAFLAERRGETGAGAGEREAKNATKAKLGND